MRESRFERHSRRARDRRELLAAREEHFRCGMQGLTGLMTIMTHWSLMRKGHQVGTLRIDHSPQGMAKLDAFLAKIVGCESKEQMACIIETTHGLFITHLLEAGWPVYPVNPRTVDRRRSASGARNGYD